MLDGIRVLDLSDETGLLCGTLLADLGADVVCIEPPGGSHARRLGPFADGQRTLESSLYWWSYARNKRSAVLDLESESGRAALRALADRADVLIESAAPGALAALGLGHRDLSARNPGLITVSITPFGQDGPKAHWPAADLTVLAAGGPLWLTGDDDRPPVRVRVPQGFNHAGCEAAVATLIALHERTRSGLGQHVDLSAQQAVALATQTDIVSHRIGADGSRRYAGGSKVGPVEIRFVYPAADGHVSITHLFGSTIGPATQRLMACVHADGFCDDAMLEKDWIGYAETLGASETLDDFAAVKDAIAAWTSSKTKQALLELSMERSLLIAPVSTAKDALESPQLAARRYFEDLERPDGKGTMRAPGAWAKFGESPLSVSRRAPRLGEHTDEVLAEFDAQPVRTAKDGSEETSRLPLDDVVILDFMWALAGPAATRILADYGATVIRIESSSRIDVCRTLHPSVEGSGVEVAAVFHNTNIGKRMMTLDITRPESRELILDLVRKADVVCESFTPGTMKKLGLDYETLRETNPTLVMLSTCLLGQTGPLAHYAGYGNLGAAIGGFYEVTGWADRSPAGPYGAYTDYIAPRFNASAVLAALEHRRRTGKGQHVDLAQAEVGLHFLAPALLAQVVNGEAWSRAGNRDEVYAPHGCYPVEGDDRWIAIAVDGDAPWRALCEELGASGLADDPRFDSAHGRREHADDLDALLSERTGVRKGEELEAALVARGIPAHRVLDSEGLGKDPQLIARGHFLERSVGELRTLVENSRSKLSRTGAAVRDTIPTFGADTQWILSDFLGYDDDRITDLVISGILE